MINDDEIVRAVRAHSAREAPRECCGLVVVERGRKAYRPCRNVSQGDSEFEIYKDDYAAAEDSGEVLAICHSHVFSSPQPSQADLVGCETSGLPWLIVNYPLGHFQVVYPSGYKAPLIGRTFCHGVLDCYTLIRDYYREKLSILIPDFARAERWWESGGDLYRKNFESAGFVAAESLIKNDVVLMCVRSRVPNHAAVYIGGQQILHHLQGRLSSRDVYGGWSQKITTHILRHRSFL